MSDIQSAHSAEYVAHLEDACLHLWHELPTEQVLQLREEMPRLTDFLTHLHHSIEHEQAMVRSRLSPVAASVRDDGRALAAGLRALADDIDLPEEDRMRYTPRNRREADLARHYRAYGLRWAAELINGSGVSGGAVQGGHGSLPDASGSGSPTDAHIDGRDDG